MGWREELKHNIRTVPQLRRYFTLSQEEEAILRDVVKIHPMNITRYQMSLIDKNDQHDPIRKLLIPSPDELDPSGEYDPCDEASITKAPGLQHKYRQTALIIATNRCAAYCRFCFRKRLVGLPTEEILRRFNDAIKYIKNHKEINNVLVTGGDPLILPTNIIEKFLAKLSMIKHLDFLRFGTRIPVAFPQRILDDPTLLAMLKKYSTKKKRIYVVTHFNHPREITQQSITAINKLYKANVIVNNQTVMLKGINDNSDILATLFKKLVNIGVNPYYLFQCRPVKRVRHHFAVPIYRAIPIVEGARKQLDGHSKRFKFVMSHRLGKVEIVGIIRKDIFFKFHQAKYEKDMGRFFKKKLNRFGTWLDDFT